jgi:hypothetical protein
VAEAGPPLVALIGKVAEDPDQIAVHGAAEAPVVPLDERLLTS